MVCWPFVSQGFSKGAETSCSNYMGSCPHLECFVHIWPPFQMRDVLANNKLQRCFTSLCPGIVGLLLEEKLSKLHPYSCKFRRMKCDLIEINMTCQDTVIMFPHAGDSQTTLSKLTIGHSEGSRIIFT